MPSEQFSYILFIKGLGLCTLWMELSRYIKKKSGLAVENLDCLAFGFCLYSLIEDQEIRLFVLAIFLPLGLLDLIKQASTPLCLGLGFILVLFLIEAGVRISFLSNPQGGLIFLNSLIPYISFIWLSTVALVLYAFNCWKGVFYSLSSILCLSLLISCLIQPTLLPKALPLALSLSSLCLIFCFYFFLNLRTLPLPGFTMALSLILACLSVLATSKTITIISLGLSASVVIWPLIFFSFLVLYTARQLKNPENHNYVLWNLNTLSLNAFMILTLIASNSLIFIWQTGLAWYWVLILILTIITGFIRLGRKVFIKKTIPFQALQNDTLTLSLLGLPIFRAEKRKALHLVEDWLDKPSGIFHIVTPDALCLLRARTNQSFYHILTQAKLLVPDGAGVLWASLFLLETPLKERIPGVEFCLDLILLAQRKQKKVFLLGAKPEVIQKVQTNLETRFGEEVFAGFQHGYFKPEEETKILDQIQSSGASIVLVALGVPRQEEWIERHRNRLDGVCLMGVGGSFDILAGTVSRCPKWVQEFSLEWLYRCLQHRRLTRLLQLPLFVKEILIDKLKAGDQGV